MNKENQHFKIKSSRVVILIFIVISIILIMILSPFFKFLFTPNFQLKNASNYLSYKSNHPHISNEEVVTIVNNKSSLEKLGYTNDDIESLLLSLSIEQLDIIIDKVILASDLMTYLNYSNFDFALYDTYETVRLTHNQNHLFAVNLVTYPYIISPNYPDDKQVAFLKDSDLVLVNKGLFLTATDNPSNLKDILQTNLNVANTMTDTSKSMLKEEALNALEILFASASDAGNILYAYSGYRTYERQEYIFDWNYTENPTTAESISARAGHSEHQTGLAIDVTTAKVDYKLTEYLGDTEEGIWLANNAHKYGFIIRYPKGKSNITGFNYEPWHLRYVGKEVAKTCYDSNLTLEEYILANVELGQ